MEFLSSCLTRSPSDVGELEVSVQPEVIPFPALEIWGEACVASGPAQVRASLLLGWMGCGFTSPLPPVCIGHSRQTSHVSPPCKPVCLHLTLNYNLCLDTADLGQSRNIPALEGQSEKEKGADVY